MLMLYFNFLWNNCSIFFCGCLYQEKAQSAKKYSRHKLWQTLSMQSPPLSQTPNWHCPNVWTNYIYWGRGQVGGIPRCLKNSSGYTMKGKHIIGEVIMVVSEYLTILQDIFETKSHLVPVVVPLPAPQK